MPQRSYGPGRFVSVRPSVRPSQAGIVSKRLDLLACICGADTSLEDFPLPNVNEFMDVAVVATSSSQRREGRVRDSQTVLPRSQLDYHLADHHAPPQAPYVDRSGTTTVLTNVGWRSGSSSNDVG